MILLLFVERIPSAYLKYIMKWNKLKIHIVHKNKHNDKSISWMKKMTNKNYKKRNHYELQ